VSKNDEITLVADVDDKISFSKAILLGFQHVLAMDLYIVPIILASILAFTIGETSILIQATFLSAGIATIIQVSIGIKLPVVQGPSYIPIGALASIGGSLGIPAMIGSLIPGAILITLLGYFKVVGRLIRRVVPPIVAGTVILVIGIALMPVAMTNIFQGTDGSHGENLIVATSSAVVLVVLLVIGSRVGKALQIVKLTSVLVALIVGTIIAMTFDMVDFSPILDAPWIALPHLFGFGMPVFDLSAIVTMIFIYFVILIESTGTWFAVGTVIDEEITRERIDKGTAGEGLGLTTASLLGGLPVTGYSTNAGIIAVTGVASRQAILAAGGILMLLGLVPKFTTLISVIPEVVIMGVFTIVTVIIAMNGLRIIKHVKLTERNMLVIGIPILFVISGIVMPEEVMNIFPEFIQYLISAGMAIGALMAVLLNLVLKEDKK